MGENQILYFVGRVVLRGFWGNAHCETVFAAWDGDRLIYNRRDLRKGPDIRYEGKREKENQNIVWTNFV